MKLRYLLPLGVLPVALLGCPQPTQEFILLDYPEMVISSQWVEFGLVEHGDAELRSISIQNTGDLPMGVSSVSEGHGRDTDFEFNFNTALISCPEGGDTADPDEEEGEAKDMSPAPDPLMVLSVNVIDFGEVDVGSNAVQSFDILNVGDDPLELTTATITPSDSPFAILGNLAGITLEKDESVQVYLSYSPTTMDGDTADVIIVSNDPSNGGVATIPLLGNSGGGDTGDTSDDTDEPVDDTGTPDNQGDDQVLFVLDAGCQIPVDVSFAPVNVGEIYGSLVVETHSQLREDNEDPEYYADLDETRAIIYLKGEAEKGEGRAIVKPRTVDFGHVWTDLSEVRYIEVANAGDGDLTLTPPTVDDSCDEDFKITWSYAEEDGDTKILAGDTQTLLEVTYTPDDTSASYCTLSVHSDDQEYPEINVNLQGNSGKDPENESPTVVIRSPEPGYRHLTTDPVIMELNIFDVNQPATSLSCRVKSAVQLSATVAQCTASDASGHVEVEIPMEYLDPGVDTLLVEVIDASATASYASIPVLLNTSADDSDDDGDGYGEIPEDTGDVYDCDDNDINSYPKAAEISDGADNDCDGTIDEGTTGADDDGDAFTEEDGDCDDQDANTYPGAPESADRRDNDCDGTIDEQTTLYDDDGDGYAEVNLDCNDVDPEVNPGAVEICDDIDNDCNGLVDDACLEVSSAPIIVGGIDMTQTACEIGESIQLSVFVYDADGQEPIYVWSMDEDGGTADNTSAANITWTAPSELPEGSTGELYQVYVVAQDPDGTQVWDFTEIAVYPKDTLYQQFVQVVTIDSEKGCATGLGLGGFLATLLAMGMLRRRED